MKTLKDYLEETIRRYGAVGSNRGMGYTLEQDVSKGHTPSAGELARDLRKMSDSDFSEKYSMSKKQAEQHYSSSKLKEQDVTEEENAASDDPLLAKAIDLAPVGALEESAELRLILQRAKLTE